MNPHDPAPTALDQEVVPSEMPARGWRWTRLIPDIGLLGIAFAIWMRWTYQQSADAFFVSDFWAHLGNGDLNWETIFDDHASHWISWNVLLSNVTYDLVGLEFWPWWGLIRLATWATLAFWVWFLVMSRGRRRGYETRAEDLVARGVGITGALVVLTLASAIVYKPWLIGIAIGHTVWSGSSMLMDGEQTNRRRVALALCLLFGISAGSITILFILAALVVSLFRREDRFWVPSLLLGLATYLLWTRLYGDADSPSFGLADVLLAPVRMVQIFEAGIDNHIRSDRIWSIGTAAVLIGGTGLLVLRRPADGYFARGMTLLLVFVGANYYSRVLTDISPLNSPRYSLPIIVILVLTIAPTIAWTTGRSRRALVCLAIAVMLLSIDDQNDRMAANHRFETRRAQATEAEVHASAHVLAEGFPHRDGERIRRGSQGGGVLTYGQLAGLVNNGWRPNISDEVEQDRVRGLMLFDLRVLPEEETVGCGQTTGRYTIDQEAVYISADSDQVRLGWEGVAGVSGSTPLSTGPGEVIEISALDGVAGELYVDADGASITVCTRN